MAPGCCITLQTRYAVGAPRFFWRDAFFFYFVCFCNDVSSFPLAFVGVYRGKLRVLLHLLEAGLVSEGNGGLEACVWAAERTKRV